MKIAFLFLLFFNFTAFSQCDSTMAVDFPDVEASFPGGASEMHKFIMENIEYPEIGRCSMGIESGRIFIKFLVCSDGSISNVHCIRGTNSEHNQAALDVIQKMPNWIPAEENGHPVAVYCLLPITIHLQ